MVLLVVQFLKMFLLVQFDSHAYDLLFVFLYTSYKKSTKKKKKIQKIKDKSAGEVWDNSEVIYGMGIISTPVPPIVM